jgi:hypothetical protein
MRVEPTGPPRGDARQVEPTRCSEGTEPRHHHDERPTIICSQRPTSATRHWQRCTPCCDPPCPRRKNRKPARAQGNDRRAPGPILPSYPFTGWTCPEMGVSVGQQAWGRSHRSLLNFGTRSLPLPRRPSCSSCSSMSSGCRPCRSGWTSLSNAWARTPPTPPARRRATRLTSSAHRRSPRRAASEAASRDTSASNAPWCRPSRSNRSPR